MQHAPVEILRQTLQFPRSVDHLVFTGGDAKTVTVPAGARYAVVSVSFLCFASATGTAATPVADTSDQSGVLILPPVNPAIWNVKSLSSFSIAADNDALAMAPGGVGYASIAWYGDPSA